MYLVYSQKAGRQSQIFPLNAQIRFLSELFDNKLYMFSMQGHMSKGRNASKYIDDFNKLISSPRKTQHISFGVGYKAKNERQLYIDEINRRKTDGDFYLEYYNLGIDYSSAKNNHSKAYFYFDPKGYDFNDFNGEEKNINDFINHITVYAAIIGSSNQSWNTYFRATTDKGEADILLLYSDNSEQNDFIKSCEETYRKKLNVDNSDNIFESGYILQENSIISKSISLPNLNEYDCIDEDNKELKFLKAIFKQCLENECK